VSLKLPGNEHALAMGAGEGMRKALVTGQPAPDKYQRHQLILNTIGPNLTNCKPPKNVQQHLGQFAHTLRTYHDYIGVLQIGVYKIRVSSPFQPMCSVSQSVLIAYLSDFCMVGLTPLLGYPGHTLLLLYFHWFSNTCFCYLRSDNGY
jgi:hypothetical protein